ncbi:MAG: GNAT family N-acetyltransferase [Pseudomonadota bacterium]
MQHERAWTAAEFADMLGAAHTRLTHLPDGFALWRAVADEAELLTIAVDPSSQRQGRGTTLMQMWHRHAARVAQHAFLEVADDNAAARALYHKCGYVQIAQRAKYYARPNGRTDALILRRDLTRVADSVKQSYAT